VLCFAAGFAKSAAFVHELVGSTTLLLVRQATPCDKEAIFVTDARMP